MFFVPIKKKKKKKIYKNWIKNIQKCKDFMNTENIKTDKPHRFRSTLADKHKDPNKIWHWPV